MMILFTHTREETITNSQKVVEVKRRKADHELKARFLIRIIQQFEIEHMRMNVRF